MNQRKYNIIKITIGGIFGSLVVLAIVIWFPLLTEYQTIEEEKIHTCQQLVLDTIELNIKYDIEVDVPTKLKSKGYYEKLATETMEKADEIEQLFKDNDCLYENGNYDESWYTQEFKIKAMILIENLQK